MTPKRKHLTHNSKIRQSPKKKWENKIMHSKFIRSMDRQLITEEEMILWLSKLKEDNESEIIAAQD